MLLILLCYSLCTVRKTQDSIYIHTIRTPSLYHAILSAKKLKCDLFTYRCLLPKFNIPDHLSQNSYFPWYAPCSTTEPSLKLNSYKTNT